MKNTYKLNLILLNLTRKLFLILIALVGISYISNGQIIKPFSQRTSIYTPSKKVYNIKGDYAMFGNTNMVLKKYGDLTNNGNNMMVYADADNDPNTLNSSSASLSLSNENGAIPSCSNIIYAGLYWTGRAHDGASPNTFTVTKDSVTKNYNKQIVSLKGPGATNYTTITANLNDTYFSSAAEGSMFTAYAEVTDYVRTHGVGDYFVADIALREGIGGSIGFYGGWGIVVVYENTKMNRRDITLFDGDALVLGNTSTNYELPISGFYTVQSGKVNMKLGIMAGEGDAKVTGDYFQIVDQNNTWTSLNHSGNTVDNFFNSSIQTGGNDRNPNLKNNSGIDIALFNIPNDNNSIIANNQTSTKFRYGSTNDTYMIFVIAMAVDAYIPIPEGMSYIESINNLPVTNSPLILEPDQSFVYKMELRNKGNEEINNTKIVIPIPYTANYVGSSKNIFFTPLPTPDSLYFDPSLGANGSVVWDFGTLPKSADVNSLLGELRITMKATTDCGILTNSTCTPKISINGSFTGTGATSDANLVNFSFISGYNEDGACIGEPITEPINLNFNSTQYIQDHCQANPPIRSFYYCNTDSAIPISDVSGNFPAGSKFYDSFPISSSSIEYTLGNPFPATPGVHTYYAVPSGENVCYFEFTITVDNITTVPSVNDLVYCQNEISDPLTATASNSAYSIFYFTSPVGGVPNVSITPSTSAEGVTTYYVAEGTSDQCIGPNRVALTVSVNAAPSVVINNPEAVCSPATVDLTLEAITSGSTPGLTFSYWTDETATTSFDSPTAAGAGTYYIKGTSGTGCFEVKPVTVSVNEEPTLVINNPEAVCSSATVDLTLEAITSGSTPGLTFTYWTDETATTSFDSPTTAGAGTYYIKGTSGTGCFEVKPVTVSVNTAPTLVINNPEAVCSPATVDLTMEAITSGSTPGLTFTYWTDETATTSFDSPTAAGAGTYYIKGTSGTGCFEVKPVAVSVNEVPSVVINNPEAVCSPATVDLTLEAITSGSTPGLTFTYWTDETATTSFDSPTTAGAGTYYIKGTSGTGCFEVKPVTVSVNAVPSVVINNPEAVCSPATVDLTLEAITSGSTPGLTFTYWTDKTATTSFDSPTTAGAGTYYIKGTSGTGCFEVKPVTVSVNAVPSVVINNPEAVCSPATVDLTLEAITSGSTPGLTFTYWTDETATTSFDSPTTAGAGTYYIKGTSGTGCFEVKPVTVSVNAAPSVVINNPEAVCSPATVDLTLEAITSGSSPGLTFTYWTDETATTSFDSPTNAGAGTYYIKGTSGTGCFEVKPVTVSVNAALSVVINNPEAVCSPATVDLTLEAITSGSTPGLTFTYWTDETATTAFDLPTTAGAGTYYIKGTSGTGCFEVKPVTVSVNAVPSVVINNPEAVCSPATVDLTLEAITSGSTPGLTFSYWTDETATTSFDSPTAAGAGTYYIKGTSGTGCFEVKPVTVSVNAAPSVVINNPEAVCSPATVDLTLEAISSGSTPGLTFTYWTDETATTAFDSPTTAGAGTYYIKGTSGTGCYEVKPVTVSVNAALSVVINNPEAVCSPATVDLTLEAITSGSTPGLTYTYWSDETATTPFDSPTTAGAGTYYIKGSSGTGCYEVKPVTVIVNLEVTADAGSDIPICSSIPYTISGATAANFSSVSWTHNGAGNLSNSDILNPTYTPLAGEKGTIEFTLKAKGNSGCGNAEVSDKFILTIYPPLRVNAGQDHSIESGTSTILTGQVADGSGVYVYSWTPAEYFVNNAIFNPATIPLTHETLFVVNVLDDISRCTGSDDVRISMDNVIRPIARDDYDTTFSDPSITVNVMANDSDPVGLGLDISIIVAPHKGIAFLNEDGTITYTPQSNTSGKDINDTLTYMICDRGNPSKCSSAKLIITITFNRDFEDFEIFNLLTPNGDGHNDYWHIGGIDAFPENEVILFNRWGDKVKEFRNYNNSDNNWKGTNEKKEVLPDGVYFYLIKIKDQNTHKGWVYVRGKGDN